MRVFTWIWIIFIVICLFLDGSSYFIARFRLTSSLELALDAAITAGVVENDLSWGKNQLDIQRAREAANRVLEANLGSFLENKSHYEIKLSKIGEKVIAQGNISCDLPLYITRIVGKNAKLYVSNSMEYSGQYK